jgi:hypothetical protein
LDITQERTIVVIRINPNPENEKNFTNLKGLGDMMLDF